MSEKPHLENVAECERLLAKYGDSYRSVGWTRGQEYADLRYEIMLGVIKDDLAATTTVLDVGCGASHLYEYMRKTGREHVRYRGVDASPKFLDLSRRKFPQVDYYEGDFLDRSVTIPVHDYVVINGLFTYKGTANGESMWQYMKEGLLRAFALCNRGLAFNVMSSHVEWERDDLFHVPIGTLTDFLAHSLTTTFTIRHDYQLYEYTVYAYKASRLY
jgi:SAM-dependent methyltransferase